MCAGKCSLEVKAWNATDAPNGYIRVKDMLTGTTDAWTANVAGDYYATVDMTNCALTNRVYSVWADAARNITQRTFNVWNSAGPTGENFRHVIGVELGVGTDGTDASFAPWIGVAELGLETPDPAYANNFYHRFSATLTGEFREVSNLR